MGLLAQSDVDLMSGIEGIREDRVKEAARRAAKRGKVEQVSTHTRQGTNAACLRVSIKWWPCALIDGCCMLVGCNGEC